MSQSSVVAVAVAVAAIARWELLTVAIASSVHSHVESGPTALFRRRVPERGCRVCAAARYVRWAERSAEWHSHGERRL